MVSAIISFVGWIVAGFVGLEILSYGLHRWVFHGPLWSIHRSHHVKRHGTLEPNDVFAFFFSGLAIALIAVGLWNPLGASMGLGVGMTLYGVLYFIVHDLLTHRRFFPMRSKSRTLNTIRRAHLHHHQSTQKPGQEPFGLILFPYSLYRDEPRTTESTVSPSPREESPS
jgi:beta-carotene 3-hydroxylase